MPAPVSTAAVCLSRRRGRSRGGLAVVVATVLGPALAGCAASGSGPASSSVPGGAAAPPCPVAPVEVVVSVDQWGDIVSRLAGRCGNVVTVVHGTTGDPHEFEPTPGDTAALGRAALVVVNGAGYDGWATKAVEGADSRPTVVDAGQVVGAAPGDNPHLWYRPEAVHRVAAQVTVALGDRLPAARGYFADRATAFGQELAAYDQAVARARAAVSGRTAALTEPVFAPMAAAIGLTDVTPAAYAQASANEGDPSPGAIRELRDRLTPDRVAVLVVNTQTTSAVVDELVGSARDRRVAVVGVTETIPPGRPSFVAWQVGQLDQLVAALGGGSGGTAP